MIHECVLTSVGRRSEEIKESFSLSQSRAMLLSLYCMCYLFVLVHGCIALFFFFHIPSVFSFGHASLGQYVESLIFAVFSL